MASAQILNTGKALYAWNGTNWIPLNNQFSTVNSTRWQKVVAGGETSLSGNDDNSNPLIYSPGSEQVFLNGILLARDIDYTANNGTTITGLAALPTGGNIEIIAYKQVHFANVYNKDEVDTIVDNIDLTPYLTIASASATYEPNIPYVSASPSSPTPGTLWIDSTTSTSPKLKVYNGTKWIAVSGGGDSGFHPFFGAYK